MNLKEIEIFDFKSIRHEQITLNVNQLCLVGINECGKTSVLEALSYLNVDKKMKKGLVNKSSKNYPNGFPLICGIFNLSDKDIDKTLEIYRESIDPKKEIEIPPTSNELQFKRWGNGFDNISLLLKGPNGLMDLLENLKEKALFLDKFFNTLYPIVEFYEDEELLIEPATVEELKGNDKRFETFRRLLYIGGCTELDNLNISDQDVAITYLHDISTNITQIFRSHYKQDQSITIFISPGYNNKLVLTIRDATSKTFSIMERSPGFQYYFSFLVNKIYLNQIFENRTLIYLLDEPGRNLHPKGAKDLIQTFFEVSGKNQILFTTHNPFLTIRNNIDSLIFVYKDSKNGTKINRKPYLSKYQTLRKELGILLNDSFILGDLNLIVEGNTEKLALHRLFVDEFEDLQWLNIYNADGITNVSQALNYLGKNNLGLSGIALIDSDSQAKTEKGRKGFTNAMQQKNWSYIEINNVFGNDIIERTFEDLFPQDLYVIAFNKSCNSLKEIGVFDSPYEDFNITGNINPPIIKTLEDHFYSFIAEDRRKDNSITKQDVIRILLDDIEVLQPDEKKKALEIPTKLIKLIKEKVQKIQKDVSN